MKVKTILLALTRVVIEFIFILLLILNIFNGFRDIELFFFISFVLGVFVLIYYSILKKIKIKNICENISKSSITTRIIIRLFLQIFTCLMGVLLIMAFASGHNIPNDFSYKILIYIALFLIFNTTVLLKTKI